MIPVKETNTEPITGYRLVNRLGSGGFGEVWKCEAPGGLYKAIKFVVGDLNAFDGDGARAEKELKAIERVKAIRHPFLLSMERVESVEGELVIVMELADQNLHDLWHRYAKAGQPGIPRQELLGYLREAAEVLDLLNGKHNLQHLDIKPHNLFLVSSHVKVGDFGLVNSLSAGSEIQLGAITPLYASPELFQSKPSRFSDQYSLAIVYQELLTGCVPFKGKNSRQLLLQHSKSKPDLRPLSPPDQKVVAKALSKKPEDRYPSCMAFVEGLLGDGGSRWELVLQRSSKTHSAETKGVAQTDKAPQTAAASAAQVPKNYRENLHKVIAKIIAAQGGEGQDPASSPPSLSEVDEVIRYKFRAGLPMGPARVRLETFCQQCFGHIIREDERGCGFTVPLPGTSWSQWSGRQPTMEIQVTMDRLDPTAATPIEISAQVRALGCGEQGSAQLLREMGLPLLDSLRNHLLIKSKNRAQERVPWPHPILVYPFYPDGKKGEAIQCQGKDIALSGIGFYLPCELYASEVLIDLAISSQGASLLVPATVVRARRCINGAYEVGALFRLPALQPNGAPPAGIDRN
jgi:serine/threonine protein kinase